MFCTPWWQDLAEELQGRQKRVSSLQEIVSELLPEAGGEDSAEAREKLHVIGSKLRLLSRQVNQDLQTIEERLVKHSSTIYSTQKIKGKLTSANGYNTFCIYTFFKNALQYFFMDE